MRLPPELVDAVVSELAAAEHPFRYGYTPDVLAALYNLCLSSHDLCAIARPWLYNTIVLADLDRTTRFACTICENTRLAGKVYSLSLQYAHNEGGAFDFDRAQRIMAGESVPPLPHDLGVLAALLLALAPYVRRLIFDRPLRELPWVDARERLREALNAASFMRLEEFASIQCELFVNYRSDDDSDADQNGDADGLIHYANAPLLPEVGFYGWPQWSTVKRLCLHNPLLDDSFAESIHRLPLLTHLVVDNPDYAHDDDVDDDGNPLRKILQHPALERLIVIRPPVHRAGEWLNDMDESHMRRAGLTDARPELEVVRLTVEEQHALCQNRILWIRAHIEDGTIWTLEGRNLRPLWR